MKKLYLLITFIVFVFVGAAQINCEFFHNKHVQGVAYNGNELYWVYTDVLIKSDASGKIIKQVPLHRMPGGAHHGGDPCFVDGKLYVPYCGSGFNKYLKKRENHNYIQQYSADLEFEKSFPVPELEFGAGCIAFYNGRFFVAGGRPSGMAGNTVYEYDRNFRLLKKHELPFDSNKGIQTLTSDGKYWYFGVYNKPSVTFIADMDFQLVGKWNFSNAVGLLHYPDGRKIKIRSVKRKTENGLRFGGALLELDAEHTKLQDLSR